ncbi:MAG: hypothetical protein JJE03_06935 [Peptostreptococcaceae bacterium]|nr:hypothetical protein [Peptostreptococcaceae bacterium]
MLDFKYDAGGPIEINGEIIEIVDAEMGTNYIIADSDNPDEIYCVGDQSDPNVYAVAEVGNIVTAKGWYEGFAADGPTEAGGRDNIPYVVYWSFVISE